MFRQPVSQRSGSHAYSLYQPAYRPKGKTVAFCHVFSPEMYCVKGGFTTQIHIGWRFNCGRMTEAEKAVIDQQERSEAGASGDGLGAPFSLPALCEERTYSPPASGRWYCLRQSCALRGAARRAALPCPVWTGQQTPPAGRPSESARLPPAVPPPACGW